MGKFYLKRGVTALEENESLIIGRNAVLEAIKSGRTINTLMLAKGERSGSVGRIISECRDLGVVIKETDRKKLDYICGHSSHQGVVAYAAAHDYADLEDVFALAEERGEPPFIIVCDELEDPHNLGAVIRTADASGAHGVIVPKRRSAALTYATAKTAAGALEYVPVVRVSNIASTLELLKERGVWIYGADMDGVLWSEQDMSGAVALVIGSEGSGLSRLAKEKCDYIKIGKMLCTSGFTALVF